MQYSLDTNVCIQYLRSRNATVIQHFNRVHFSQSRQTLSDGLRSYRYE